MDPLDYQNSLALRKLVIDMYPIAFPEQNTIFVAKGCYDLPACIQHNDQFQCKEVVSCWKLSEDDCMNILKQIEAGKKPIICLSVIGGQPPVSLWVSDLCVNTAKNQQEI